MSQISGCTDWSRTLPILNMPPSPLENSTHPSPMLSPCTDQRNERHSALQPHTGTGGKHSVTALTQQNPQMHKHTLAHTPTPINSQTSGPQHSTTCALTLHFCIKKSYQHCKRRVALLANTQLHTFKLKNNCVQGLLIC